MRRDAPTSEPGGSTRPCMATGHAIVNSRLAGRSHNRRAGHAMPIGLAIELRVAGVQGDVNRMGGHAIQEDTRGPVPANREWRRST